MKYFKTQYTVGTILHDDPEQIGTKEELMKKKIENSKKMNKDKTGKFFSPLSKKEIEVMESPGLLNYT